MDEKVITPLDEIDKEIRFEPEPEWIEADEYACCSHCNGEDDYYENMAEWSRNNDPEVMVDLLFDPKPTFVRYSL
jgi:hypothetical protein